MTTRQLIVAIVATGTIAGGWSLLRVRRQHAVAAYEEAQESARLEDERRRDAAEGQRQQEQDLERARQAVERADEMQRHELRERLAAAAADAGPRRADAGCRCQPGGPLCTCL